MPRRIVRMGHRELAVLPGLERHQHLVERFGERVGLALLNEFTYVEAARALGVGNGRIMWKHILPNSMTPVVSFLPFRMSAAILALTSLDFLGLGVPPPQPSWGSMIGEGRESLEIAPRLAFLPAIAMFLTVLSFNLVGDTLRALTDPRLP